MAFAHPVLFYRGAADYLTGTVPFIRSALAAGEPVAAVVPTARLHLLRQELGTDAHNVWLVDMSVAGRNPGHIIPGLLRAFADKHEGPVRIVGEPVWPGRTATEYPACAQHEVMVNYAFAGLNATVLCPYDADNLPGKSSTTPSAPTTTQRSTPRTQWPRSTTNPWKSPGSDHPHDPRRLPPIRRFVSTFASRLGLERVDDMVLAVDELTANSVRHGGGAGTVYLWSEPDAVVCQVEDRGHLTNPWPAGSQPR
ncbi:sensor histidine kinase [Kibdelosporangium lantanae]